LVPEPLVFAPGAPPPKPVVHPVDVGFETTRLVAANPPELFALPCARMHFLTTKADDVAFFVAVNLVAEPRTIFLVEVAPLCDVEDTVMDVAETAVTLPETGAAPPVAPVPPVGAPVGRVPLALPDGALVGGVPLRVPPPNPPNAMVHVPAEVAAEIETVVAAAVELVDELPDAGVENDETHDPTVTEAAVLATVSVIVVEPVYVTAVWFEVSCTCSVPPEIAAIVPVTPPPP
jgi:hypothetical protein